MNWKKEYAKEAWMQAKKQDATVLEWENSTEKQTAEKQFETWWSLNYE